MNKSKTIVNKFILAYNLCLCVSRSNRGGHNMIREKEEYKFKINFVIDIRFCKFNRFCHTIQRKWVVATVNGMIYRRWEIYSLTLWHVVELRLLLFPSMTWSIFFKPSLVWVWLHLIQKALESKFVICARHSPMPK